MSELKTIAIVGGGPAGAMAAECFMRGMNQARSNWDHNRVVVYEEKVGWEKPCGGGLSPKALKEYPYLLQTAGSANPVWKMEMCAPGGATVHLNFREPLVVYSRRELNHFLLQKSRLAGAEVVTDRINCVNRVGEKWCLTGRAGSYGADYLILAAGARSALRNKLAGPLSAQDFMLTYGYYVPGHEDLLRIEFFEDFEGYAWSFPRKDHLSVGICGKVGQCGMSDLRRKLARFMACHGYSPDRASVFSHLLPSLEVDSWARIRLEGEGWALAGDVAGLVDPITGEGLYFALRSGELLADSLLNTGCSYTKQVWNEFGAKLMLGARFCPKFYRGEFLGAGVTTRMIQFCGRSRTFLNVFQDLVEGKQTYCGLRNRLLLSLPAFVLEVVAHTVRGGMRLQSAKHA